MTDNALKTLRMSIFGVVTISAIASATVLAVLNVPIGFTICAGLLALICVLDWVM